MTPIQYTSTSNNTSSLLLFLPNPRLHIIHLEPLILPRAVARGRGLRAIAVRGGLGLLVLDPCVEDGPEEDDGDGGCAAAGGWMGGRDRERVCGGVMVEKRE